MNDSTGLVAGLITFVVIVLIYLWASLALAAVFRKAGEDAWQAWVPILNTAVLLRLGGFSPWLVFIGLVPFFGQIAFVVIVVMSYFRINRAFGFGAGMTVVAALFPLIWASIVGFGSARWIGAETAGPRRSGDAQTDAAPIPRVGPFDVFEPLVPRSAPSAPAVSPAASAAPASAATGFWAPPPPAPPVADPTVAGPRVAGPPVAAPPPAAPPVAGPPVAAPPAVASARAETVVPPAAPPVPPTPVSFLATRADQRADDDGAVDPEDRIAAPAPASSTFSPPPPVPESEPRRRTADPDAAIASVPTMEPLRAPEPVVEPVAEVPEAAAAAPVPWAPARLRTPAPAATDPEQFPELSEAVSAVAGAPDAGAPRSARSSVSALYAEAGTRADDQDDDLEAMDQTIVARRRRVPWTLIPPGGTPVDISSEVVILGRRPAPDPTRPGAQLISIADETRTVSKTHARLELRGETWFVTDLGSTNGVLFATLMGTEVEAQPGQELEAGERFFLGDAEVRLKRSDT